MHFFAIFPAEADKDSTEVQMFVEASSNTHWDERKLSYQELQESN